MAENIITLNVTYTVRSGQGEAFAQALDQEGVLERVRREPGCLQYELFAAVGKADRLMLVERWDGQDNLDAHSAGENFKAMQAVEKTYVTDVDVRRFG